MECGSEKVTRWDIETEEATAVQVLFAKLRRAKCLGGQMACLKQYGHYSGVAQRGLDK